MLYLCIRIHNYKLYTGIIVINLMYIILYIIIILSFSIIALVCKILTNNYVSHNEFNDGGQSYLVHNVSHKHIIWSEQ